MLHPHSFVHRILRAQHRRSLNQTLTKTSGNANVLEREPPIQTTSMSAVAATYATVG